MGNAISPELAQMLKMVASNGGNFALMLALAVAVFGTFAAFFAAIHARESYRLAAVRSFIAATILVFLAVISLGILLQLDDFSIAYVYQHSNVALPWHFKLTAIWGGSAGSLMWWTLILAVYTCFFLLFSRKAPRLMMSWAMVMVGICLAFFLIINNIVANPFETWHEIRPGHEPIPFSPPEGKGLNPQLQHWAMIIHPPLLYTGYIGFLFPFAMALGALITRMEGRDWIRLIRRWTLTAWLILGVGIILGGAWAYMELGWGGYWAWDPVENASFMPWLLATAFIHSVMAQEKRGMFKMWNILLLVATFLMCMFGTFITRSGLISSVHAFAKSSIGTYFIVYIVLMAIVSLVIVIWRRSDLTDDNPYESVTSRESSLLFNNVLFITICVTMLLATIYPMVTEAVYGTKRELRHGFYNKVEIPLFLGLLFLMAAGPILTWKRTSGKMVRERFVWPAIAMVVALVCGFIFNQTSLYATISFAVLSFLAVTIFQEFWVVVRRRSKRAKENAVAALVSVVRLNKRRYGGYISHFAILVMGIGLTGAAFNQQNKKELGEGGILTVGKHVFQVEQIDTKSPNDNYVSLWAKVNLLNDGKMVRSFYPEQRFYRASESQASEIGIGITPFRDYYVVLAGTAPDSTREHPIGVFHIYVNPLVLWVWLGGLIMIFGTFVCMLPDKARAAAPAAVPAGLGETAT